MAALPIASSVRTSSGTWLACEQSNAGLTCATRAKGGNKDTYRRSLHLLRVARCRALRATLPAETSQRLPASIDNDANRGAGREKGDAPFATATAATSAVAVRTRTAVSSPTWRAGVTGTARAVATRNKQVPGKGSVSGRRGSAPSSAMRRWCRRACNAAVAPRLEPISEPEGDPQWTSAESLSAGDRKSMAPLVGAETRFPGGSSQKEEGFETCETKEGGEEQVEEREAEGKGNYKGPMEMKQTKEMEEMKEGREEVAVQEGEGWRLGVGKQIEATGGEGRKMEVTDDGQQRGKAKDELEAVGEDELEEEREKVGLNEGAKEEEGEEEEEGGEEAGKGGVIEEEEDAGGEEENKRECGNRDTEGRREMEEMKVIQEDQEGEGAEEEGAEEEEEEEKEEEEAGGEEGEEEAEEDEDEDEDERDEEWATAGGVNSVARMVVEASAVVKSGSEASSVDSTFASLGVGEERGSLVPAEFRPPGSEDDVLCAWNLGMVPTRKHAAILGSGSFGSVVGVRTEKGQDLAMKVVVKAGSPQESRIRAETELLRECSVHPHVVDLHGTINTAERLYMIMSKADTTLLPLTKGGVDVDEVLAAQFTRQLVSAVEFLHSRMIIHRDIKPANILLRNGEVLLADFGLAARTKAGPFAQTDGCGTEMYLAPELMFGMRYGLAIDMWATGVVAFQLLHRMHPFWPNKPQTTAQPSRNAGGDAAAALNGANGVRSSSSLHSSGFFSGPNGISEGLSSLNSTGFFSGVGEDAGPVFDVSADEEVRVGREGLSSENGGGSAGVRAEARSLPPAPPGMLATQAHQATKDLFKNNVMKAHFTVKEGLEQTAVDFLKKLLCQFASDRMSAAEAAKHEWLNRSPEDHHARRSELRARTIDAMSAKRALRLDAAIFKAEQAVGNVEQLKECVQSSSVLGQQSSVTVSAAAAEATGNIVSHLRECAQRVTSLAGETREAQGRAKSWEAAIAAGETGAPPDMQVAGEGGIRFVGSYTEHMAAESVRQAEKSAGEAEARSTAAVAAVEAWERRLTEIAEEAGG